MESANLHDHHQQQQQLVDSSPSVNPSFYEVGTTRAASWTPYPILNNNGTNFNPNIINGAPINSRYPNCLNASNNNSMIQDLEFGSFTSLSSVSDHDLQLSRIKEELSSSSSSSRHSSYPKFTEMLKGSPSSSSSSIDLDSHLLLHPSSNSSSYIKNEQRDHLLKTFSSGCHINGLQLPPAAGGGGGGGGGLCYSTPTSRRSFSQIYPTINISNLNQLPASSEVSSSSLVMNLEALDLFNSARFSGTTNISHSSQDHQLGLPKSSLDYNMQQQLTYRQSNSPTNVSPFNNGVTEVKRSSSFLETKAPQATPKKSRLDSRSSCPPFKVRKEKLGDRIAALQQLVAPFGKTDTASVLMETIGYIKFLQNQVEALSVPYMKSSRNKARKMQGGSGEDGELQGATRDLRSRGLCLVPLTCLSYVTDHGGGGSGVWPPPNFGGPAAGSL